MSMNPLHPAAGMRPPAMLPSAPTIGTGDSFARLLQQVLGRVSQADVQATQAIQDLATGEAEDVHTAALAVAQADLSFRLALEIRNRLQEAYQQVTQLQV